MATDTQRFSGSCLCGGVQYFFCHERQLIQDDVRKQPERLAHCHCRDCQKFHGAGFSTFVTPSSPIEWTSGAELLKTFATQNGALRQFCINCGSSLTFRGSGDKDQWEISLATLDLAKEQGATFCPDAHVFYDSKAPWLLKPNWESLPKYKRGRHSELVLENDLGFL